jgi:hypothetical protein
MGRIYIARQKFVITVAKKGMSGCLKNDDRYVKKTPEMSKEKKFIPSLDWDPV